MWGFPLHYKHRLRGFHLSLTNAFLSFLLKSYSQLCLLPTANATSLGPPVRAAATNRITALMRWPVANPSLVKNASCCRLLSMTGKLANFGARTGLPKPQRRG